MYFMRPRFRETHKQVSGLSVVVALQLRTFEV